MLYKIMLVDDEEEVRKSIIGKILWEEIGYEVVGDAENGEDAMDKIGVLDPDVIMTDIQMPYMDGLELTQAIRNQYPEKEVVIFSGYNDFEYAQKAIQLGVTEYILKPVNSEEMTEILKKLKLKLDADIADKRNINALRESYKKNFPVLKEKFLKDWMEGMVERVDLPQLIGEYAPNIKSADQWLVAMVQVNEEKSKLVKNEKELVPVILEKVLDEKLMERFAYCVFNYEKDKGVIIALEKQQSVYDVLSDLNLVIKECKQVFYLNPVIGVGQARETWVEVSKSFLEAKEAMGYRRVLGSDNCIFIKDVEPQSDDVLLVEEQEIGALVHALKFDGESEINDRLSAVFHRIQNSKMNMRQYQSYFISVFNPILQVIWKYELDEQSIFGYGVDYYQMILKMKEPRELEVFIRKVCVDINRQMISKRENTTIDIVKEAKDYIAEHYDNPRLSVEMLCSHLHLSQSYFSTVFKKETGQNYVAYLTEVRLTKAAELLKYTDDKTYIIASKVGYLEPNYFSYVFKKQFGMSPSKYRGK